MIGISKLLLLPAIAAGLRVGESLKVSSLVHDDVGLAGTSWTATKIMYPNGDLKPALPGFPATLTFKEDEVEAYAGCNHRKRYYYLCFFSSADSFLNNNLSKLPYLHS